MVLTACLTGCDPSYYGDSCDTPCGAGCEDGTCDPQSGTCTGWSASHRCKDGYKSTDGKCDQGMSISCLKKNTGQNALYDSKHQVTLHKCVQSNCSDGSIFLHIYRTLIFIACMHTPSLTS
eukprot:TRINITY_DN13635_c0_g1_i8.p1 TRINITY_DN13635_c0_g1~~TRINITY_DN13635_c0_g1_i8.p1  ORF type:complete len:121 (+),score=11.01 TRINITY_DN13635_c0_g1_i8:70-432(+)